MLPRDLAESRLELTPYIYSNMRLILFSFITNQLPVVVMADSTNFIS